MVLVGKSLLPLTLDLNLSSFSTNFSVLIREAVLTSNMAFSMAMPWSRGEEEVSKKILGSVWTDNPTSTFLTPQASFALQNFPLLAVGTVDDEGRPWSTIWGGEPGFAQPLGSSIIGTKTLIEAKYDPVVQALVGKSKDGEIVREEGQGRMVGGLAIDLNRRKRVKLYGRMVAGALTRKDESDPAAAEIQVVVKIEQSLGNCPKYLNKKDIIATIPQPQLISTSPELPDEAIALIGRSDLFFVSSSNAKEDMDTNHRGGPPGFVRMLSPDTLIWPEYSGNRLYQTLGNLYTTPKAGLVVPDFETGDVLYITGDTEILIGKNAAAILPRSNLAVKLHITSALYVRSGLPFRGVTGERSPYNPDVRLTMTEKARLGGDLSSTSLYAQNTAKLISKTQITPSIARFRFAMSNAHPYEAGQWAALDFSGELDIGYSHMRDDDPRSINDDFVRTFTVCNPPGSTAEGLKADEFEMTIRKNGPVTGFLFSQSGRSGLEVPLRGFGGDFEIKPRTEGDVVPFIAGGVGITPLMGQMDGLDPERVRLFWTLRAEDVALVKDFINRWPKAAPQMRVFFTGDGVKQEPRIELEELQSAGVKYKMRRLTKEDLQEVDAHTWYLCAGKALKDQLLQWLGGKEVLYEDFNY